jgi:hypothetical protein
MKNVANSLCANAEPLTELSRGYAARCMNGSDFIRLLLREFCHWIFLASGACAFPNTISHIVRVCSKSGGAR